MNTENQNLNTETPSCEGGVMLSYLLLTKEHYSDGVSEEYEDIVWATNIDIAKAKAEIKISIRNSDLGSYGKCYFLNLSPC